MTYLTIMLYMTTLLAIPDNILGSFTRTQDLTLLMEGLPLTIISKTDPIRAYIAVGTGPAITPEQNQLSGEISDTLEYIVEVLDFYNRGKSQSDLSAPSALLFKYTQQVLNAHKAMITLREQLNLYSRNETKADDVQECILTLFPENFSIYLARVKEAMVEIMVALKIPTGYSVSQIETKKKRSAQIDEGMVEESTAVEDEETEFRTPSLVTEVEKEETGLATANLDEVPSRLYALTAYTTNMLQKEHEHLGIVVALANGQLPQEVLPGLDALQCMKDMLAEHSELEQCGYTTKGLWCSVMVSQEEEIQEAVELITLPVYLNKRVYTIDLGKTKMALLKPNRVASVDRCVQNARVITCADGLRFAEDLCAQAVQDNDVQRVRRHCKVSKKPADRLPYLYSSPIGTVVSPRAPGTISLDLGSYREEVKGPTRICHKDPITIRYSGQARTFPATLQCGQEEHISTLKLNSTALRQIFPKKFPFDQIGEPGEIIPETWQEILLMFVLGIQLLWVIPCVYYCAYKSIHFLCCWGKCETRWLDTVPPPRSRPVATWLQHVCGTGSNSRRRSPGVIPPGTGPDIELQPLRQQGAESAIIRLGTAHAHHVNLWPQRRNWLHSH